MKKHEVKHVSINLTLKEFYQLYQLIIPSTQDLSLKEKFFELDARLETVAGLIEKETNETD